MNSTDQNSFGLAWARFEAWLAVNSPADHGTLRGPATSAEIAELEDYLGFALHSELQALLELHNGAERLQASWELNRFKAGSFLPGKHRLSSTGFIAENLEVLRDISEDWSDWQEDYKREPLEAHAHLWVPFAHSVDGGMIFIDHCPGPSFGHVYEAGLGSGGESEEWATNLAALFETITHALESESTFLRSYVPRFYEHQSGARCLDW